MQSFTLLLIFFLIVKLRLAKQNNEMIEHSNGINFEKLKTKKLWNKFIIRTLLQMYTFTAKLKNFESTLNSC